MRAAQWDFDTARLMGVDVDRAISITFAIGSALAAVVESCGASGLRR